MKRVVAALAVILLVVSPAVIGVAVAQDDGGNQTTTTTANGTTTQTNTQTQWSPPGPYTRDELKKPGAHDPDAEDSIRLLGDPVRGGLGFRYKPAKPFQNDWEWLEKGSTVRTNRMQVKASAFGDATGEYTLVVVYWEEGSKRVQTEDGVVRQQYAANQTVQRVTIDLESGYTTQWIELRSVFDGKKKVSMWLERDGSVVTGARWTEFHHETNPLAKAPASPMTSKFDVYKFVALYVLAIGVPCILLGRYAAQHVLDRTIISTQWGLGMWFGILTLFVVLGLTVAWWQLSVIAAGMPAVFGFLIGGVAFIGYMGMYDNQVERAEFNRKDLEDTTGVMGDDTKTARHEDIKLRNIVRREGKIYMPKPGIRPLIARYWADPAQVDESDLKTVNDTSGDVSKKYEIDPSEDETLIHTPARLSFDPDITRDLTDEERETINEQAREYAEMDSIAASLMTFPLAVKKMLLQINWRFVGISVVGFAILYSAVNATFGLPAVGTAVGILPCLIVGTKAKDGSLDFEPAPYHFSTARAILVHERKEHGRARTFEELESLLADIDMENIEKAVDLSDAVRDQYQDKMDDLMGIKKSDPSPVGDGNPAANRDAG